MQSLQGSKFLIPEPKWWCNLSALEAEVAGIRWSHLTPEVNELQLVFAIIFWNRKTGDKRPLKHASQPFSAIADRCIW